MNAPLNHTKELTHWWALLISGILLFLAGCIVFQYPVNDYLRVSTAFGLVMLLFGLCHLGFIMPNRSLLPGWKWQVFMSITDIALAITLIFYANAALTIPVLLGSWFFIRGLSMISYALTLRQLVFTGWGWILTAGILTLLLALFVMYNPVFGFITIAMWTSLAFILTGLFFILLSLKVKQGRDEIESIIL